MQNAWHVQRAAMFDSLFLTAAKAKLEAEVKAHYQQYNKGAGGGLGAEDVQARAVVLLCVWACFAFVFQCNLHFI